MGAEYERPPIEIREISLKAKYESEGLAWQAYHNREANRWSALKAMAEVESKRTQVELANQKVAFAESRLQRACSKLRGKY